MSTSRIPRSLSAAELPRDVIVLCLGCAALGASLGLFATGNWDWGIIAILLATVFFVVLTQPVPQKGNRLSEQSATAFAVWRTRCETALNTWRTRARLDGVETERGPALQALGSAVREGDRRAAHEASRHLDELDQQERSLEADLERQATEAEERIRRARLPVQETVMVSPSEPNAPYPPPDEGDPPTPAIMPEPSPPPDEGTPPAPTPDPDDS